jgi:hypothetical protein
MLNEEGGEFCDILIENIDSLCDKQCVACDAEEDYFKLNPPKRSFTQKCHNCENYKKLFLELKERENQCYQLRQQINFACHHKLHQQFNQIKSVDTQLKTGITERLRKPLMKIAQKLLISYKATFEQLTTPEQKLWSTFETEDIYRFLTGEPDTFPEFQYNWTSIPRLQTQGPTISAPPAPVATAPAAPANPQQPPQPPVQPPAPPTPPESGSSGLSSSSSPHSSPMPSTTGTRPKTSQAPTPKSAQPNPSGASTSGTKSATPDSNSWNLRQHTKVDYKDLHTGATAFGQNKFQKRCSKTGASVQKSVAKVRKMSLAELFLPISRNSSSSSTAFSK